MPTHIQCMNQKFGLNGQAICDKQFKKLHNFYSA